jgi:methionine biosynthesis protein MetW
VKEAAGGVRFDHQVIMGLVPAKSTVLDLGCGSGDLLHLLVSRRQCKGHGIEIDEREIYQCVAKGLNVLHGDIDSGLSDYSDQSFDYVILNQSLQQVQHFDRVFLDALRVGRNVVVGFPNFAHLRSRCQLFFKGRAPMTGPLPFSWNESPNIRFLSIYDFEDYCRAKKVRVLERKYLGKDREVHLLPNLRAQTGIFVLSH